MRELPVKGGVGVDLANQTRPPWRLSLVLPAYNEAESIGQALQEANAALKATVADFEILVVDDGSRDETAAIVEREAAHNPRIHLIRHEGNQGYGAALRTGFQAASMELVAFSDADCQFDLHDLEYMLPLSRRYDLVCGYRIERQDPTRRRFFSWGYNTLTKLLLGNPVHDVDCALKVFHRDQIQTILPECDNFFVNTEMLTKARMQGMSIVEVGVKHRPRAAGESKVALTDIPKTLSTLLPFWWTKMLFPARDPAPSTGTGRFWLCLAFLALLAGLLLFPNLSYPLIKPDEWRYAEIGRTMVASGDWLVPRLGGEPYYDKPPLYYWLTATSLAWFGSQEWAARLVPALAAFLTVLLTYVIGRRSVGDQAAFLGALALTLTTAFVQCGRFIVLDSLFGLFVSMALLTAHEAIRGQRLRWPWWLGSAILAALAVLTKGPAGFFLVVPPVVAYCWLSKTSGGPNWRQWCLYLGLATLIAAPWFIAMTLHDPRFARHFFHEHHLRRFFSNQYHASPFWFYAPVLLIGCLPWSLLLIPAGRYLFSRSLAVSRERFPALGFMLLGSAWTIVFFSLSRGKLPPYILPALPGLALVVGCYLHRMVGHLTRTAEFFNQARVAPPRQAVLIVASTWLVVGALAWRRDLIATQEYLVEAALCLAAILAVTLGKRFLTTKTAWALAGLVAVAVSYQASQELIPAWARQRSPLAGELDIAELLQNRDIALASYGHDLGTIPFEWDRGDPANFTGKPYALPGFLEKNARTLLVTKSQISPNVLRQLVPAHLDLQTILNKNSTRVYLIEAAAPRK